MKTKEVVKYYGSKRAVAEALGISVQAVYLWRDRPPLLQQYIIQSKTGGQLKVSNDKSKV